MKGRQRRRHSSLTASTSKLAPYPVIQGAIQYTSMPQALETNGSLSLQLH